MLHRRDLRDWAGIALGVAFGLVSLHGGWWALPLFGVGIGLLFAFTWQLARERFRRGPLQNLVRQHRYGEYSTRWAQSATDITIATKFLRNWIREDPPDEALIQALHGRNNQCVKLIERKAVGDPEPTLVGVVVVAPLNRAALTAIERGQVQRASDVDFTRHIQTTWRNPAALYVGAIAGSTDSGRRWALTALELISTTSCAGRPQFTRPVTVDGRRAARDAGFEAIAPGSEIWRR